FGLQDVLEKMVVTVPMARVVKGYEKEIGRIDFGHDRRRVFPLEYGVTEGRRETPKNGRLQEKGQPLGRLARKQLAEQVVHDVAVASRDQVGGDAAGDGRCSKRECSQRDRCRPTLRPLEEAIELAVRETDPGGP